MKQILAKTPFFHRQIKILVGGRNHAHIHGDLVMPAQPEIWRTVEHPQQLHLDLRLQFANFIEKDRAFVGELKQSRLGGIRAAESPLFVAE